MEGKKTVVTREGLEKLEKEHEYLIQVERPQVIEELRAARAQGDLSENADYDAARDHQARVEARIKELDTLLANVEIIEEKKTRKSVVRLGSTVTIEYLDTQERETFNIVGTVEADPFDHKISNETPLAIAIMDHKVNDVVPVLVSPSYEVRILEIK
ncbi:MAG: transcription elongation factor GreA [Erysipelotrichaceae bacterium]|nr:transcription elongation factor GreA [Erysipelotrichaceae bacterium]